MRPAILNASLIIASLAASTLSAGCASCSPQGVDAELSLSLVSEEVRTLPMLSSGATRIVGVPLALPDSHGYAEFQLDISHESLDDVEIEDFRLDFKADTKPIAVHILQIDGGSNWQEEGSGQWAGEADTDEKRQVWWAVDADRVERLTDLVLPEGALYTLTIEFDWTHDGCDYEAKGHTTKTVNDHVMASVNAKTFESQGTPILEADAEGVGFQADYRIRSGLTVTLQKATAMAVYRTQRPTTVGLVTFPNVAWTVNDLPGSTVTPTDTLETFSSDSGLSAAAYKKSGVMTPPTLAAGKGLYILLETLEYTSAGTVGSESDTFAYGIVKS